MPSIFEGYNYDVFISYRQNDNKYDGWVTEFVDNLKKELEANIKDKVSVYFDINPTDGLLETDSVDKSLADKLKCLIFIPIISRTYCDAKSFAWQHEFCAFNKLVREDKFGRDIKLASGNVTSRILPVKIHDLDPEDKMLLENEIGGVLRNIEFIYKSAGVNRPLRANEDHPQDNLNKTYYRDQINKVANAIKEIINGLKHKEEAEVQVLSEDQEPKTVSVPEVKVWWKNKKYIAAVFAIVVTLFIGIWLLSRHVFVREIEKSIAVLPFKLLSDEPDKQYLADGMMDAITLHLSKIKDLRVMSRTSVEQYRGTTKTTRQIGKELDVEYLLEGSFQKYADNARLIVQLIKASEESHAWGNEYNSKWSEVFSLQSEVAQSIAKELDAVITPDEKQLIEKIPTTNQTAYNFYLQGEEELSKFTSAMSNRLNQQAQITNRQVRAHAKELFTKALEYDSTFAQAYTGLVRAGVTQDSVLILVDKALSYDKQLSEAHLMRGYYYNSKGNINKANNEFDIALTIDPNSWEAYYWLGIWNQEARGDLLKSINYLHKAASLNHGSELADIKYELSRSYRHAGFYEKSKDIALEVLKLDGDSVRYLSHINVAEFFLGNITKALELAKKAYSIDSTNVKILINLGGIYLDMGKWEEALKYWKKYYVFVPGDVYYKLQLGYVYLKNGYKKEAEDIFDKLIKTNENNIKLNPQSFYSYSVLACIYAIRGDEEKVYENLSLFSQIHVVICNELQFINRPWFDSIRDKPEFKKIESEIDAKFQAQHERVRKWLEEKGML